jgi:AcrR family transcriptional regulator
MSADSTDKKPRLSADRIVDVALAQLRERGYDAVTMRSIASALGTGPASLYAHVANRNELDGLVMTRISSQIVVPAADSKRWADQLTALAHDMLRLYREHPGTARCAMASVPTAPEALVTVEALFAILRAGGIPDQDASWFGDQYALYIAAFAMEEDIWKSRAHAVGRTDEQAWDHIPPAFARLSPVQFPILTSMTAALMAGDPDERFAFGIDLLIRGLKARAG